MPPSPPLPKTSPKPADEMEESNRSPKIAEPTTPRSPHRALPQPVETSHGRRKGTAKEVEDGQSRDQIGITSKSMQPLPQPIESNPTSSKPSKPRRFAPEVVETSRSSGGRSRRNTAAEKDEKETPGPQDHLPPHLKMKKKRPDLVPAPPDNSPSVSTNQVPQLPESKFSSSKLKQRIPRQHSFHHPRPPGHQVHIRYGR